VTEASPGTPRPRAGASLAAALACTRGTAAVPDRNDRRNEAELDTARSLRAGTPTTTGGSMPPFSGHGARAVMNVTASRRRRLQKARGYSPGLSLFGGRAVYAARSPPAQILTGEW
jgi:hypothetical protein